jgi:hypothetical protein
MYLQFHSFAHVLFSISVTTNRQTSNVDDTRQLIAALYRPNDFFQQQQKQQHVSYIFNFNIIFSLLQCTRFALVIQPFQTCNILIIFVL